MRLRTLPILAALVFALASPLLAAEDPQAPYTKPPMDETQPAPQPQDSTALSAPQQEDPVTRATPVAPPTDPAPAVTPPEPATPPQQNTATSQTEVTTTTAATPEDSGLPKTASPLALLALLGLGGAGSAYRLRQARRL